MGGLCTRLLPECVLLDPLQQDKERVIRQLVDRLASSHSITDPDTLFEQVMEREKLGSTCLGFGCAVPHARTDSAGTTVIAAARLNPPVSMDAPDGEPVSLVFLMAGPEKSAALHLRLLSKLARLLHSDSLRAQLCEASTAEDFHQIICSRDD